MTYAALDTSVDAGAPFELFEFVEGSRAWRYTTSPSADTWGGQQWLPRPIMREAVVRDSTSIGDPLVVTLPDNDPLALELLAGMSVHLVTVKIRQLHRGDPDAQARVLFTGMVSGVSFQGAEAKISCGSRYALTSKRRIAPTTYQAACNLTWGSSRCGVNPETYRVSTTTTASDQVGRTLRLEALSSFAEGYFNGGEVVLNGTRRFIEKHEWVGGALTLDLAALLTLSYPFGGLTTTPTAISVYPNCQKTEADCTNRYNNLNNYLGWTRLPSVNPYNRSAFYLEDAVTVAPPAGSSGDLPGYPGYSVYLPPSELVYERGVDPDWHDWTFTFTSTGYLLVKRDLLSPGGSGGVLQSSETAAPSLWGTPRPLPGYGNVEMRIDLALGAFNTQLSSTRVGAWFDPTSVNWCRVRVLCQAAASDPALAGKITATVRVRNKTTGIVIAQGDLSLTVTTVVPPEEHG